MDLRLLVLNIDRPILLSVVFDLHVFEALDVRFELGISVVMNLEIPEPVPDPVAQRSQGNSLFSRISRCF